MLFSDLFKVNETLALQMICSKKILARCTRFLQEYLGYDLGDKFVSGFDYESIVNIVTIHFNFKCWQRILKKLFDDKKSGFDKKCYYLVDAVLFSFLCIFNFSFILLGLIMLTLISSSLFFLCCLINVRGHFSDFVSSHAFILSLFISISFLRLLSYLPYITLLFFAGLILNAVYFSTYVTFFSVLIFYSWTSWQDVETKYSTLKMPIYEVCKDSGLTYGVDDGGCDDGEYNRNNEPMISKQFYDGIREKILPYNLILFNYFIKFFFVCVFAYFLFTIVSILNTADISATVKVITTLSVSVVPHIFNVFAAKNSEEEKKVQKIQVEKLVSEGTDQV